MRLARGPVRRALVVLGAVILSSCATSNLHQRPPWTLPPGQWSLESGTETAVIRARYAQAEYLLANGIGRASRLEQAEKLAEQDARRRMVETICVKVFAWMESETQWVRGSKGNQYGASLRSFVRTSAEGMLAGARTVREWVGYDRDDTVAFTLLALHKPTTQAMLRSTIHSAITAAQDLRHAVEKHLADRDLGAAAVCLAQLYERSIRLRAILGNLHCFSSPRERSRIEDWSHTAGELDSFSERLVTLYRRMVTSRSIKPPVFVRSEKPATLVLTPRIAYDGDMLPLVGCDLRIADSPRMQRGFKTHRTDTNGTVRVPLAVDARTRAGEYHLDVTLRLCKSHGTPGSEKGCAHCELEERLQWRVPYKVEPDYDQYAKLVKWAKLAASLRDFAKAKRYYTRARAVVFDVSKLAGECDRALARLAVDQAEHHARHLEEGGHFHEALTSYRRAERAANRNQDRVRAVDIRQRGERCACTYISHELDQGDTASRERCFASLKELGKNWSTPKLRRAFKGLCTTLPCTECNWAKTCRQCKGTKGVLRNCHVCQGKGTVLRQCTECRDGLIKCKRCNGRADTDTKPCPDCGGNGRVDCGLCSGGSSARCLLCSGTGSYPRGYVCYRCRGYGLDPCGLHDCKRCRGYGYLICGTCKESGKVPTCKRCEGSGKEDCEECVQGKKRVTCPFCKGKKRVTYWCEHCRRTGKCPRCGGTGHRRP